MKYYITKEYNLNAVSDPSNYKAGRFIFRHFSFEWPRLYGIAELPARNFFNPDHNIESIYLERRQMYSVGQFLSC